MNRSALVIRMLHILRAHNSYVPIDVIAKELETNSRNIREFKKELEVAGYQIETKRGVNGGYYLSQSSLMPANALSKKEQLAIDSALKLLKQRPDFLYYNDFVQACGKFLNSNQPDPIRTVYQQSVSVKMSPDMIKMVDTLQDAAKRNIVVEISYASLNSKGKFRSIIIHPYDVVNIDGSYYVVAYSLGHYAYRSFKISQERMRQATQTNRVFDRDKTYQLSHHVGSRSIAKTSPQTVSLKIYGDLAIYISENDIGLNSTSHFEHDCLHLTTTFDNEKACDSFVLSLGPQAEIVGPDEIKQRIEKKVALMYQNLTIEKE